MRDTDSVLQTLQESEERLQAFMRHSPVLAFMKDAEGRYVYVNPRMESVFQIKLAEIQGKADFEWLPEAAARTVRENDQMVLTTGRTLEILEIIPMPDGTLRQWMVLKFPFTKSDGQTLVGGVAVDITERVHAEQAAQRKEQEVRTLLDHTPDAITRFDRSLRHVYVNPATEAMRGLSADQLLGKTLADIGVSREQRDLMEGKLRHVFVTAKQSTIEGLEMSSHTALYYQVRMTPEFDDRDQVQTVLVTSRDITKLKQAEKRLIDSEQRYRRLFEGSLGLMCTHDIGGELLSVNAAAANSLGYEPHDLLGSNLRDLLAPHVRRHFDAYLERIRSDGTDKGLMLVASRDGQTRMWKYHNALISEAGRRDYVLGHAQDVTDLHHAQEAAKNLSLTDELTGLYNRRGFLALAEQQLKLALAPRTEKGLLLIYADMDDLKQVNDRFGHREGSRAIASVAAVLKSNFRGSDIIARFGGDEFVVLTINAAHDGGAQMAERLHESLRRHNAQANDPFELSLSIGTATVDAAHPLSIEELLQQADVAMYEQKRRKQTDHRQS